MKRATIILTLVGLAATAHADVDPVLNVEDRVSRLEATVDQFLAKLDELSERHESLVEKHNVLSEGYIDLRGCVLEQLESVDQSRTCIKLVQEHEALLE